MPDYNEIVSVWKKRQILTVDALDAALSNYRILFAYHSNRIENAGLDIHQTREIFENGKVINYTGDLRTLFETSNQKECYDFLREHIVGKTPITPDFICQVHKVLTHGCYDESRWKQGERPGEFKKNYYGVGDDAGASPEDVTEEIQALCDEILKMEPKASILENVLKIAAYFHLAFENIHPFADGNGRVGRTLMNYYLLTHDLPPVIIYDEDRKTYYMALTVFDKTGRIDGFVQFLKEECVKTWTKETPIRSRRKGQMLCL